MIFPAEQLGKAFDHYDMARDGIADGAYVNPGYQPGRFPIIAASDLPFQYHDAKTGTAALDAWYRAYAAREMKDVKYCFAFIHDPGTLHSKRKVVEPTDLRGLKIRPSNATMGNFVTLLGGNNVQASAPAARDLLERGVADGIFFPWGSTVLFGIDKVVKYHLDAHFYASTFVWVLNKGRYDGLSSAQRKVIDDHCTTEWAVRFASPWADFEAGGRAKVQAKPGQEIVPLAPAQLEDWRRAAEPLRARWAAEVRRTGQEPGRHLQGTPGEPRAAPRRLLKPHRHAPQGPVDRFITVAERAAGIFLAFVTALTFASVVLRYVFSWSIPDSYDLGRNFLGILIFWGIAVTGYRGDHITVDLLWGALPARFQRILDYFDILAILLCMGVFCWATALKVIDTRNAGEATYDLNMPVWPFYFLAWIGTATAVILMVVRLLRAGRRSPAASLPPNH